MGWIASSGHVAQVLWRFRFSLLCALIVVGLWDTPLIKPFRVFVVLVHEGCHAAVALATGGEVMELRTHWDESGTTSIRGGCFPLISSAGYVGAAVLGSLLMAAGVWPRLQRLLLFVLGCGVALVVLLYTPAGGPDFYLGLGAGLLVATAAAQSARLGGRMANWFGVLLCLYSLDDFRADLWRHPEATDAGILARYWHMPWLTYPIALLWVGASLLAMYGAMQWLVRHERGALPVAPQPPAGLASGDSGSGGPRARQ